MSRRLLVPFFILLLALFLSPASIQASEEERQNFNEPGTAQVNFNKLEEGLINFFRWWGPHKVSRSLMDTIGKELNPIMGENFTQFHYQTMFGDLVNDGWLVENPDGTFKFVDIDPYYKPWMKPLAVFETTSDPDGRGLFGKNQCLVIEFFRGKENVAEIYVKRIWSDDRYVIDKGKHHGLQQQLSLKNQRQVDSAVTGLIQKGILVLDTQIDSVNQIFVFRMPGPGVCYASEQAGTAQIFIRENWGWIALIAGLGFGSPIAIYVWRKSRHLSPYGVLPPK